jgi:PKD domain-containing protein
MWSFDDGTRVAGLKASHAFALPGNHRAVFTATDKDGGSSSRAVNLKIVQRASTLAYAGPATAPFGFGTAAATLADAVDPATASLDDHALSFTAGGVSFDATTAAGTGTASVGGTLLPGTYAVDARFAGDKLYSPSFASGNLSVVNSAGKVTGDATLGDGTPVSFAVSSDGAAIRGEFRAGTFSASSVTALGIAGQIAWLAGTGTDGRAFVASVDDAGEPGVGVDSIRIWIDGTLQSGSGTIASGNVQLHR